MNRFSVALCGLVILAAVPARSQVADLSRATCAQLLTLPRADQGQLLLWLHGYYAGAAQRAALDPAKVTEAADGMLRACQGRADLPLVGAEAREIFLGTVQPQVPPSPPALATPSADPRSGPLSPPAAGQAPAPSSPAPPSGIPRPVR